MKIGIIGDVHLGASLAMGKKDAESGINTRLADYDSTLNSTIYDLYDKGCETLVFTGDIFEHRTPTMKQQELFSAALRRAIEKGFKGKFISLWEITISREMYKRPPYHTSKTPLTEHPRY